MTTRLQPGSIIAGVGMAAFAAVAVAGVQGYRNGSTVDGASAPAVFKPLALATASPDNSHRAAPADRGKLARAIQKELARVGCYDGVLSSHWSPSARAGMKSFVEAVNARLPIDEPDDVLLTLVESHQSQVCGLPTAAPKTEEKGSTVVIAAPSAPYRVAGEAPPQTVDAPPTPAPEPQPAHPTETQAAALTTTVAAVVAVAPSPAAPPISNAVVEPLAPSPAAKREPLPQFATTPPTTEPAAKPQKRAARKTRPQAAKQPKFVKSLMKSVNSALSSMGLN
ncbi:MAG: hypothetical protein ACT4OU_02575 [Hyphomicrobium sp.]